MMINRREVLFEICKGNIHKAKSALRQYRKHVLKEDPVRDSTFNFEEMLILSQTCDA